MLLGTIKKLQRRVKFRQVLKIHCKIHDGTLILGLQHHLLRSFKACRISHDCCISLYHQSDVARIQYYRMWAVYRYVSSVKTRFTGEYNTTGGD